MTSFSVEGTQQPWHISFNLQNTDFSKMEKKDPGKPKSVILRYSENNKLSLEKQIKLTCYHRGKK